jgi:large subunit ribosomal protein L15
MEILLSNRVSLCRKRKRVGRGGSRGGTSGKGTKGQLARAGAGRKLRPGFEGGQMPLHRRLPKRGFNNTRFKKVFTLITLEQLEKFFTVGEEVTKETLLLKGLAKNTRDLVKVLGTGTLSKKLRVTVDAYSASAAQVIASCGGEVCFTKEG